MGRSWGSARQGRRADGEGSPSGSCCGRGAARRGGRSAARCGQSAARCGRGAARRGRSSACGLRGLASRCRGPRRTALLVGSSRHGRPRRAGARHAGRKRGRRSGNPASHGFAEHRTVREPQEGRRPTLDHPEKQRPSGEHPRGLQGLRLAGHRLLLLLQDRGTRREVVEAEALLSNQRVEQQQAEQPPGQQADQHDSERCLGRARTALRDQPQRSGTTRDAAGHDPRPAPHDPGGTALAHCAGGTALAHCAGGTALAHCAGGTALAHCAGGAAAHAARTRSAARSRTD